jgi:hypothetical protein
MLTCDLKSGPEWFSRQGKTPGAVTQPMVLVDLVGADDSASGVDDPEVLTKDRPSMFNRRNEIQ